MIKDFVTYLNSVIRAANDAGIIGVTANQKQYFEQMDQFALESILTEAIIHSDSDITLDLNPSSTTLTGAEKEAYITTHQDDIYQFNRDMSLYSYAKFCPSDDKGIWESWDLLDKRIRETIPQEKCLSSDFVSLYKSTVNSLVANYRTCLATKTDKYGTYGYSTDGIYVNDELTHLPYEIKRGDFVLASTVEYFKIGETFCAQVDGKSTLGRRGLCMEQRLL